MLAVEDQALLVVPSGFGNVLNHGEAGDIDLRLGEEINRQIIAQEVQAAAADVSRPYQAARSATKIAQDEISFANEDERQDFFENALTQAQQLDSTAEQRFIETQPGIETQDNGYDRVAHQSVGQMVTWVFIPLLGISSLLAYERSNGTLRRLLVTPTRRHTYLFGTLFGQVILALIQMALLIGFGALVLKVDWGQSPAGLILIMVCFSLASAALGTALGAFTRTAGQATNLSIMIGMLFALLGGAWVPMEVFPAALQTAVKILPTTWAMQGLMELVVQRQGLVDILPEAAVLLGFFVLFLFVGVRRFRFE